MDELKQVELEVKSVGKCIGEKGYIKIMQGNQIICIKEENLERVLCDILGDGKWVNS